MSWLFKSALDWLFAKLATWLADLAARFARRKLVAEEAAASVEALKKAQTAKEIDDATDKALDGL